MAKRKKRRPGIRIRLKSFDHKMIEWAARRIVEAAQRTGSDVAGPVPLPLDISKQTTARSPFTGKQFEMRTHKRLIDVLEPTPKTVDALMRLNLPAGVDIEIRSGSSDREPPTTHQSRVPGRRVDVAGKAPPDRVTPTRPSPSSKPTEPETSEGASGNTGANAGGGSRGGVRPTRRTSQAETGQPPDPPASTPPKKDKPLVPFAEKFFESQTTTPSDAPDIPVVLPPGGPKTGESAHEHTRQSDQFGRSGARVTKTVRRWHPTEAAKKLSDEFRSMVPSDYDGRCQICGTTFKMSNGELQVFVVHIVPPRKDHRTNHFGNLVGLCGWHYALVRDGEWALLNPETNEPFGGWEYMRDFVLNASEEMDDVGNTYVGLPVRFWNVYRGWSATADFVDEEIRYSMPHWTHLRERLSA